MVFKEMVDRSELRRDFIKLCGSQPSSLISFPHYPSLYSICTHSSGFGVFCYSYNERSRKAAANLVLRLNLCHLLSFFIFTKYSEKKWIVLRNELSILIFLKTFCPKQVVNSIYIHSTPLLLTCKYIVGQV